MAGGKALWERYSASTATTFCSSSRPTQGSGAAKRSAFLFQDLRRWEIPPRPRWPHVSSRRWRAGWESKASAAGRRSWPTCPPGPPPARRRRRGACSRTTVAAAGDAARPITPGPVGLRRRPRRQEPSELGAARRSRRVRSWVAGYAAAGAAGAVLAAVVGLAAWARGSVPSPAGAGRSRNRASLRRTRPRLRRPTGPWPETPVPSKPAWPGRPFRPSCRPRTPARSMALFILGRAATTAPCACCVSRRRQARLHSRVRRPTLPFERDRRVRNGLDPSERREAERPGRVARRAARPDRRRRRPPAPARPGPGDREASRRPSRAGVLAGRGGGRQRLPLRGRFLPSGWGSSTRGVEAWAVTGPAPHLLPLLPW